MRPLIVLNDDVEMPALGYGVFLIPPDETADVVETAIADGYRLIDTAAAYLNERQVGEGIRRSGIDRSELFIETNVWISDYGYDATLHAFEKSTGSSRRHGHPSAASPRTEMPGGARSLTPRSSTSEGRHGKSAAQVMLRWHLQEGRGAIPKSSNPGRIAENFDVFDFELSDDEIDAIDRLDTGVRGGPDPESITLEKFGRPIPEA